MVKSVLSAEALDFLLRYTGVEVGAAIELMSHLAEAARTARLKMMALVVITPEHEYRVGYTVGAGWWVEQL